MHRLLNWCKLEPTMSVESILQQAEELTLEQRAELLRRLESGLIAAGWQPEVELSEFVSNMLEDRIRSSDANPGGGIPWEVVRDEARKRWSK